MILKIAGILYILSCFIIGFATLYCEWEDFKSYFRQDKISFFIMLIVLVICFPFVPLIVIKEKIEDMYL